MGILHDVNRAVVSGGGACTCYQSYLAGLGPIRTGWRIDEGPLPKASEHQCFQNCCMTEVYAMCGAYRYENLVSRCKDAMAAHGWVIPDLDPTDPILGV